MEPWEVPPGEGPSWHAAMARLSGFDLTRGNGVRLLFNGEATFDSILAGIAEARQYVLVEFYMIRDDGLGRRVKQALIDRARQGVSVYVLYDEIGSKGVPAAYVDELRAADVEVSSFKPTQGSRNRFQLDFRTHRKMVVVDGRIGWVGGHNVGDEYLGLDPEFSPWRDTHVRLEGPVVQQLQMVILGDWYWATRETPGVNWTPEPAEGGVDVRIITTGKPDSLPVYLAAFHCIEALGELWIKFYEYKPGFLHEKVMLVDDEVSAVGTPNFDNRSFRLNFEVTAVILDADFAAGMERMFEVDFAHAAVIDPGSFGEKPLWWRAAVKLSRLAAPVL